MCRESLAHESHQNTHQQTAKPRKPKNRKHASKKHTYTYQGDTYGVYAGYQATKGLYTPMLKAILDVLYFARESWGRVLVVRFDLSHKGLHTTDSKHVSEFIRNLKRKIERRYNTKSHYVWAREYGAKEGGQHYHFALFLDGNKVKSSYKVLEIAEATWAYTFHIPKNPYYVVDTQESMQKPVYRLSYLAKVLTKGHREPTKHDYDRSQLRRKST